MHLFGKAVVDIFEITTRLLASFSQRSNFVMADEADTKYRTMSTDLSADEILDRSFEQRKGTDKDVLHTAMRTGYHDPLKGRIGLDTLECADGTELYRLTIDGEPFLYDDEDEDTEGWMTYDRLLCFIEGYKRMNDPEYFAPTDDE